MVNPSLMGLDTKTGENYRRINQFQETKRGNHCWKENESKKLRILVPLLH